MKKITEKLRDKIGAMKRESLLLYFIIGIYLIYTGSDIIKSMDENPENTVVIFTVAAIVFFIVGGFFTLIMTYALLKNYYARIYNEEQERLKAEAEGVETSLSSRLNRPSKAVQKYLNFMYKIFKIR